MQGGGCYEEVHDLWQRVTKAEQAASQAAAELQMLRGAARHATLELKVSNAQRYACSEHKLAHFAAQLIMDLSLTAVQSCCYLLLLSGSEICCSQNYFLQAYLSYGTASLHCGQGYILLLMLPKLCQNAQSMIICSIMLSRECAVCAEDILCLLLQEVKRESALRYAEGADLRIALREAHARGAVSQALTSLQAELSYVRCKSTPS